MYYIDSNSFRAPFESPSDQEYGGSWLNPCTIVNNSTLDPLPRVVPEMLADVQTRE
jgi:hypothetical protein